MAENPTPAVTTISPWMDVIAREVEFAPGEAAETLPRRRPSRIISPLLRARPMAASRLCGNTGRRSKRFTWELPAGWSTKARTPALGCERELLEETGYPARAIHPLGPAAACTGRLSNRIHSFFVETGERIADFTPEPGITVALKSPAELVAMIKSGEFIQQLHLGALMLAELRQFLKLP